MAAVAETEVQLLRSVERSEETCVPFRHWRLFDVFAAEVCAALASLPLPRGPSGDTRGKRETHNHVRRFFSPALCRRFPVCRRVAADFAGPPVLHRLEQLCALDLTGSFLRIEYCQDGAGFWLEPHTDIGAKLLTMQVYLSQGPDAAGWGTDLLDQGWTLVTTVPAVFNSALLFVPADDTWHGFHKRPIEGVRRSIIINYVKPEWRSRHELVDPRRPAA